MQAQSQATASPHGRGAIANQRNQICVGARELKGMQAPAAHVAHDEPPARSSRSSEKMKRRQLEDFRR